MATVKRGGSRQPDLRISSERKKIASKTLRPKNGSVLENWARVLMSAHGRRSSKNRYAMRSTTYKKRSPVSSMAAGDRRDEMEIITRAPTGFCYFFFSIVLYYCRSMTTAIFPKLLSATTLIDKN